MYFKNLNKYCIKKYIGNVKMEVQKIHFFLNFVSFCVIFCFLLYLVPIWYILYIFFVFCLFRGEKERKSQTLLLLLQHLNNALSAISQCILCRRVMLESIAFWFIRRQTLYVASEMAAVNIFCRCSWYWRLSSCDI